MTRRTFTAHYVICIFCAGAFAFLWHYGVPQLIFANDQSYMTSAIAALVIGSAVWIGYQAILADYWPHDAAISRSVPDSWYKTDPSSDFGQEAQLLAPALGMLGTVIGLSMQAKALVAGAAGLGALSTSLFTTGAGILGFIVLKILTLNLESGIKRAGR